MLAAGLAVAVGSIAPDAALAQAKTKDKGKTTERFENRDRRGNDRTSDRRVQDQRRIEEQRRLEERRRIEARSRTDAERRVADRVLRPVDPRNSDRNRDWDRDRDWDRNRDWDLNRRDSRIYRDDDFYRRNQNGPAFCRSGAGHPVYGRQWCARKGYSLGTRDRWERVSWNDVIFGRRDRRYDDRSLGRTVLGDILGRTMLARLDSHARYVGGGTLNGRWLDDRNGPLILQVYAGRTPLAEFVDANRDGRTDYIMVNRGTR